jgi:hypothetical protein
MNRTRPHTSQACFVQAALLSSQPIHNTSINGCRHRSGNRQISHVAFGGFGIACNASRSTADAYLVPDFTLMNRTAVAFQPMMSAGPLEAAARVVR